MNKKLTVTENIIYFSIWISGCCYSLYKLYQAQTVIFKRYPHLKYTLNDLAPGWRFLRRRKDVSDSEWNTCLYILQLTGIHLILQFILSEILRRTNISMLKYWYIISSVLFITNYMGAKQLLLILLQPILYWLVLYVGGKKTSVWILSLVLLALYNTFKYKFTFWDFLESREDEEVSSLLYAVAWIQLRCISFCINYVDKEKLNQNVSFFETTLNMFSYTLYLPVLFSGPIICYDEFEKSFYIQPQSLSLRIKRFMMDVSIYAVYTILLDFALHYMYFYAMQSNMRIMEMLPPTALCGGGLWMGLEFHLKYVISYGTTSAFARLDNIDAPPTPRCILRIHLYSQMWRYFDVGLYKFLYRYIYHPVSNAIKETFNISNLLGKICASLTTFIFIFFWHGNTWNIFVWSALNYIGIVLEYCGKALGKSGMYLLFKDKVLRTEAMEVRFIAFVCTPLLGLSAISNFYLFAGSEVGDLYFELLKSPSLYNFALVYICLYACCHVGIALENIPTRTAYRQISKEIIKDLF